MVESKGPLGHNPEVKRKISRVEKQIRELCAQQLAMREGIVYISGTSSHLSISAPGSVLCNKFPGAEIIVSNYVRAPGGVSTNIHAIFTNNGVSLQTEQTIVNDSVVSVSTSPLMEASEQILRIFLEGLKEPSPMYLTKRPMSPGGGPYLMGLIVSPKTLRQQRHN